MNRVIYGSLTAACLLFLSADLSAATYYVSLSGSDNNSSSQAQNRNSPWRTIQRGVDQARAGDQVVVLAGTYYENIRLRTSGNAGAEITIRAEYREAVRLFGWIFGDYLSYVTVDGFDVTNDSSSGFTKGIQFFRCHHVTARSCRVRYCYGGGISFDRSDSILCEWNVVHENAFYDANQHSGIMVYQPQRLGPEDRQFGIIIRNNTSYRNENFGLSPIFGKPTDGNGIILDDFKNTQAGGSGSYNRRTVVENNICYDNGGNGIHCYLSQNIDIRNNTCVRNLVSLDFGGDVSVSRTDNVRVYNNILSARPGEYAALTYLATNFWFGFNLIDGAVRDVPEDGNSFYGPPGFVSGTFYPQYNSYAVNNGTNFGDHFPVDSQGQYRFNSQIDIGAVERY